MRPASGANISMVSWAILCRFSSDGIKCSVRILCKRSASFTKRMRISWDVASNSFLKFSACPLPLDANSSLDSLVTPSTSEATSPPNRSSICPNVASVSSNVSCNKPVAMVAVSRRNSVRIPATSTG